MNMKVESINIANDGYVHCKSCFYSAHDSLSFSICYKFSVGINQLIGEIDSGIWAISYLISMYRHKPEDFILFENSEAMVNNCRISLYDLSEYSCYMDKLYPLFSTDSSVKELISCGIEKNKLKCSPDDIRELFRIDNERFERSLSGVGNEVFRAMSAIGYVYGKEVFCFPWLSKSRFNGYHGHMTDLLDILNQLRKVVIIPVGK